MLILGSEVLIGFQFRAVFEKGFSSLPSLSQYLLVGSLVLMLIALCLLVSPAAYHRITENGNDTEQLHRFTMAVMWYALLPFSLSLGIDLFVVTGTLVPQRYALFSGGIAILVPLFFWYGLEMIDRRDLPPERSPLGPEGALPPSTKGTMKQMKSRSGSEESDLDKKIKHVLTEVRVVLPGAQALLGFQFITFLMEGFNLLPTASKYIHLASLAMVALSTILLITPAAYHRVVEEGENTAHFHRFASRMILMAMIPLALGVTGDFFVVVRKITGSVSLSAAAAGVMLLFFYGFWFGLMLYRKRHPKQTKKRPILIAK